MSTCIGFAKCCNVIVIDLHDSRPLLCVSFNGFSKQLVQISWTEGNKTILWKALRCNTDTHKLLGKCWQQVIIYRGQGVERYGKGQDTILDDPLESVTFGSLIKHKLDPPVWSGETHTSSCAVFLAAHTHTRHVKMCFRLSYLGVLDLAISEGMCHDVICLHTFVAQHATMWFWTDTESKTGNACFFVAHKTIPAKLLEEKNPSIGVNEIRRYSSSGNRLSSTNRLS